MQNMEGFILINLYALLLISFVSIVFFSKKRLKQVENNLYGKFLLYSLLMNFSGILLGFMVIPKYNVPMFIQLLLNKIYLIALLLWINTLTLYTLYVSKKDVSKIDKTIKVFKVIDIINIILALVLPIEITIENNSAVPSGLVYMYSYSFFCIEFLFQIICVIKKPKNLKNKKFVPIYLLSTLGTAAMVNQIINPDMNYLINPVFIFIAIAMYHTIENPDVKMLNEVYKNKELLEETYEDKSNFLFEMTQEVREPLYEMKLMCDEIKDEKDIKKIKDKINVLNNSLRQLDFTVNDVLNVSTLEVQKVKFIDNRYSLKGLYDDLLSRIKVSDSVEFRTRIPNNLPYVYGDAIKLKQILYSLIMNSVNKTSEGFIEFSIDTIEKYDVLRVIFTIRDTGVGMSIDKINDVLSTTGEFDSNDLKMLEKTEFNIKLCQKIIKSMGGNLLIKSKIDKGTEVILTVDQRKFIKDDNENIINSYEEKVSNKKVMLVCQDKNNLEIIKNELYKKNISYSHILYGKDSVDKIKSGKKYDYIIIEDDMKEISGFETLKLLKEQNDFDIPVIVLLKDDKEQIKEQFIKDGFADYILISDLKNEIKRIIDKY